ncbi:cytochrome c oxidase assembly protein [Neobacillus cucumis]|uniref:cytochrome c oxidase assembly protein n=1 Tax=Neobacillus cucumis TaxID=1740721 RepID=UPI00285337AC|nr:cytochrome c oxidase assembly protein [Neobacillus cucumis]MDR4947587.1 cytochrome c oxidase assembly protein [Neobacillus cucumis]
MLPFVLALVIYLAAMIKNFFEGKIWPFYRIVLWVMGIFCVLVTVTGPLAARSHIDFTAHMLAHLLLGMLAPLLMVLAAPMTLLFKTLPVVWARRLAKILRCNYFRFISNPMIASIFNIGGLWLLYCSRLYHVTHEHTLVHMVVHWHIFLSGYIFTASIIYIDPSSHQTSFLSRAGVLVTALSGHGILAKYLYAHPPAGVSTEQGELASMLMYYGGDVIELVSIIILCYQWYKAARPGRSVGQYY